MAKYKDLYGEYAANEKWEHITCEQHVNTFDVVHKDCRLKYLSMHINPFGFLTSPLLSQRCLKCLLEKPAT